MPIALIILLLVILPMTAISAEVKDQTIIEGIDLMHRLEHDKAIALYDSMISRDPGDPRGYFFKAEVYFWLYLLTDFDEDYGDTFKEISELTIDVAKRRLKEGQANQNNTLYLGRAYGNLGRYHAVNGHFLKSYWASRKSKKTLQALIADKPQCYDAYFELGLYYYYMDVAKVLKLFSFLLGIEADRFQGLDYLHLAANKGSLTRMDAYFFLEDIYQRYEEDPEAAKVLAEGLVSRYPSNPLFLSELASISRKLGQFEQAISMYETILEMKDDQRFPEFSRSARYQIGKCYLTLNQLGSALEISESIVSDAVEKNETDHWTYPWSIFQIGHCYELKGERTRALERYRTIKKEPDRSCYDAAQSKIEEPMSEFDRAMEIAGNLLAQRRFDLALKKYSDVLSNIDNASDGFPQTEKPQVQFWIGRTYQKGGDCTKAITVFQQALASTVSSPEWLKPWANYRTGNCYAELGNRSRAEEHYDMAHKYRDGLLRARIARDRENLEHATSSIPEE